MIVCEKIDPETDVKGILDEMEDAEHADPSHDEKEDNESPTETDDIEVFTRFYLDGSQWKMYQEAMGKRVPGSDAQWPKEKPPFMCLRWTTVEGESYGRSYVEEYLGDLISLEGLSKGVVEAAAIAAKVVFLIDPNGRTVASDITEAESGDAVVGHKDDVHCLQVEKQADLTIAQKAAEAIQQRLSYAFLMTSAIQRNGERVTAEEIRLMASDLEDALGGVYSLLAQEFQYPLVIRIMDRMTRQKRLPELPKGVVKPVITTGLTALGRGHDGQRLRQFLGSIAQIFGPEGMARYISVDEALMRLATADDINPVGLVKTAEQIAQEDAQKMEALQQQQQADIVGKAAPAAVKAVSDNVIAAGEQQQAGPPQTQG